MASGKDITEALKKKRDAAIERAYARAQKKFSSPEDFETFASESPMQRRASASRLRVRPAWGLAAAAILLCVVGFNYFYYTLKPASGFMQASTPMAVVRQGFFWGTTEHLTNRILEGSDFARAEQKTDLEANHGVTVAMSEGSGLRVDERPASYTLTLADGVYYFNFGATEATKARNIVLPFSRSISIRGTRLVLKVSSKTAFIIVGEGSASVGNQQLSNGLLYQLNKDGASQIQSGELVKKHRPAFQRVTPAQFHSLFGLSPERKRKVVTLATLKQKYGVLTQVTTHAGQTYVGGYQQKGDKVIVDTIRGRVTLKREDVKQIARYKKSR